jgi:hypothetical protein
MHTCFFFEAVQDISASASLHTEYSDPIPAEAPGITVAASRGSAMPDPLIQKFEQDEQRRLRLVQKRILKRREQARREVAIT